MCPKGINSEKLKNINRSGLLRLISDNGAMSRKDLSKRLGLTPAAVTLVCNDFISSGILIEKGEVVEERRVGRRQILVDINYDFAYALCVCIESYETTLTICNLKGKVMSLKTMKTETKIKSDLFLDMLSDSFEKMIKESGIKKGNFIGIGVSLPGIVNRELGISELAMGIWNQKVNVAQTFRNRFNIPVIVENNVKAFVEAELAYGTGRQNNNLFFVKWGPGVGSAVVVDNQIYSSSAGSSELGHVVIKKTGKQCRCGRRGCLETIVSTHAITDKIKELCTKKNMPQLYKFVDGDTANLRARNISRWSRVNDKKMHDELDRIVEIMAETVSKAVTIIPPDQIIFYGDLFDIDDFSDKFIEHYKKVDPFYREGYLTRSTLNDKIGYIGPLALVFNQKIESGFTD